MLSLHDIEAMNEEPIRYRTAFDIYNFICKLEGDLNSHTTAFSQEEVALIQDLINKGRQVRKAIAHKEIDPK